MLCSAQHTHCSFLLPAHTHSSPIHTHLPSEPKRGSRILPLPGSKQPVLIRGSQRLEQSTADILSHTDFLSVKWELLWTECLCPPQQNSYAEALTLNVTISGERAFTKITKVK